MTSMRQDSRQDRASRETHDDIKAGCLQRIADATEAMAKNYTSLIWDRDFYKRKYEDQSRMRQHAQLRIAALKGVITKLRRKIEAQTDNTP